jgi:hypothetical protein
MGSRAQAAEWLGRTLCSVALAGVASIAFAACSGDSTDGLKDVTEQVQRLETAIKQERTHTQSKIDALQERIDSLGRSLDNSMSAVREVVDVRARESSESAAKSMSELRAEVERASHNQLAILERTVGSIVPVRLPAELDSILATLESRVSDSATWPKDEAAALVLLEETRELISQIPPWAESSYLPRITALRWSAATCLTIVRCATASPADASGLVDDLRGLEEAEPAGAPLVIAERVRGLITSVEAELRNAQFDDARRVACEVIGQDMAADVGEAAGAADAVLQEWEGDEVVGVEVRKIRLDLRRAVVAAQAKADASVAAERWALIRKTNDPVTIEAGARSLLNSVVTARVASIAEGVDADPYAPLQQELTETIEKVERDRRTAFRQSWARYQRWCLDQLGSFDARFASIEGEANQAARIWKPDNGGWSDGRLDGVRDAMVQYLVPIDVSLLDVPVLELYRKAFEKGWKRIDAGERQVFVAQKVVTTSKRPLDEVPGDRGR